MITRDYFDMSILKPLFVYEQSKSHSYAFFFNKCTVVQLIPLRGEKWKGYKLYYWSIVTGHVDGAAGRREAAVKVAGKGGILVDT